MPGSASVDRPGERASRSKTARLPGALCGPTPRSRWLRLLFAREFHINDVLRLWDGIFADDPKLSVVDYMSVAMLLFIRDGRTPPATPACRLGAASPSLVIARADHASAPPPPIRPPRPTCGAPCC